MFLNILSWLAVIIVKNVAVVLVLCIFLKPFLVSEAICFIPYRICCVRYNLRNISIHVVENAVKYAIFVDNLKTNLDWFTIKMASLFIKIENVMVDFD